MTKKSGLGRGLDALISNASSYSDNQETTSERIPPILMESTVNEIDIDLIEVNPYQPRREFDKESLQVLSDSISNLGLIQPITLRKNGKKYQLISGERRFRASKMAGLSKIPAYVREADDEAMLVLSIVENIQREDLNAIDVASGYQQLIEEFQFTQEQLSDKMGKNRSTITNYLRLLKLPPEIQLGIKMNTITMGHARAIIGVDDPMAQLNIFQQITKEDLSVRKVEELVRKLNKPEAIVEETKPAVADDEQFLQNFEEIKTRLNNALGSKVELTKSPKGSGKITIVFKSDEELNNILTIIEKQV